jgi:hypothetical protein
VKAELRVMNVYAFVVKSTGHKITFPEETAVLLDNDIANTCKKGRKHINAEADSIRMLIVKKIILDGEALIFI